MQFTTPLIIRRAPSTGTGHFTGLASSWSIDRHRSRIERGAFQASIAALQAGTARVALLYMHDPAHPIGKIDTAAETDQGLEVSGTIVLGEPIADRAHEMLLHGAGGLSVGFDANDPTVTRDVDGTTVYRSVDWMETSVVGVPSNKQAFAIEVRALASQSPAELERLLRDGELPPLPRRLASKVAAACRGVLADDDDEHDPAELAAVTAALERLKQTFKR